MAEPDLWLKAADIYFDARQYAGEVSDARVLQLATEWDIDLCDPLMVRQLPNGRFMLVQGRHRLLAARMRSERVPCRYEPRA